MQVFICSSQICCRSHFTYSWHCYACSRKTSQHWRCRIV